MIRMPEDEVPRKVSTLKLRGRIKRNIQRKPTSSGNT